MSAIRLGSLKTVWLEAFVEVANAENMSEAARKLGTSQPTVTRYMQALKDWAGRDLIEINRVRDPQDPGVNVGLTDEGREFYLIADEMLTKLTAFRTREADKTQKLRQARELVAVMHADLHAETSSAVAISLREQIEQQHLTLENLSDAYSLDFIEEILRQTRKFYNKYERELHSERRLLRERTSRTVDARDIKIP